MQNTDISDYPEIYIALCGAAGTDLSHVCRLLTQEFFTYGYTVKLIKISDIFKKLPGYGNLAGQPDEASRIAASMTAGNEIRDKVGSDAAACLAISEIRQHRKETNTNNSSEDPLPKTLYIINSLKHKDESKALRRLYKDAFVQISVYEPKGKRRENLAIKIAQGRNIPVKDCHEDAEKLIERDQNETGRKNGQDVRGVFPFGDIFIEAGPDTEKQIRRFSKLIFGAPFMTPRREEFGMYHAQAAALKSADLSRQVGAVILTRDAEIVASGCNEVPKIGGGVVWGEDITSLNPDRRDYTLGYDTSAVMKRTMLREVITSLRKGKWLTQEKEDLTDDALISDLLSDDSDASLKDARITNVIEFGRIVHAEMSALMDAARRGTAVKGLTLYCTTFPCHMCARHIIAAGVRRVIYIEPYPKSLAKELYQSEILVDDELSTGLRGVRFEPFVGVAPRRYAEWFTMGKRKDDSGFAVPDAGSAKLRKVAVNQVMPSSQEEQAHEERLLVLININPVKEAQND